MEDHNPTAPKKGVRVTPRYAGLRDDDMVVIHHRGKCWPVQLIAVENAEKPKWATGQKTNAISSVTQGSRASKPL